MLTAISRRAAMVLLLIVATAMPSAAHGAGPGDLAFLDGLTLIELSTDDIASMHAARRMIESYGGVVAIMSPPSLLIGWIPDGQAENIAAESGVRGVYNREVSPASLVLPDAHQRALVHFYNRAVGGAGYEPFEPAAASGPLNQPRDGDAFDAPALERDAYIENLRRAGLDPVALADDGILLDSPSPVSGNTDAMSGTVSITIFFVESDGSGTDPNLYTWTPEDMQRYLDGVAAAMLFWTNQAVTHSCSVSWLINYRSGADPVCQQWTEPILHDSNWQSTWINEIMTNLGYTSGGYFTKVSSFNTWQRSYYGTDRSYSAFIPYNPEGPGFFPDGATAYAYLGGPFTVLLSNVQGWTVREVFAHESGHIFYACDEYASSNCSCSQVCGNVTPTVNGNCESCNPNSRECMMKENSFSVCQYTVGQLGWNADPCAPPPPPTMPAPTITSITPASALQGLSSQFTITGTNLFPGVKVEIGGEVFPDIYDLQDSQTLVIDATVLNDAPLGLYDVKVKNRDGKNATLADGFEIFPTTRHYYSPSGGNHFPYITPTDAATDLTDALNAAFDGDTLYMPTGTFNNLVLTIDRGVLLYGAWDATFTTRDLATGKTMLDLNYNVTIWPGTVGAGFDGFIITGGTGKSDTYPFSAYFGGAIQALDASFTVANCEIHTNTVGAGGNLGLGGGIFAYNSIVDLRDNDIHDNTATKGGGVYLLDCTGTISGNTIANNTLSDGPTGQTKRGGGILLDGCAGITMSDNTFAGNTGTEGAGVYADHADVTVTGGLFDGNIAGSLAGALLSDSSTVAVDGATFTGNAATGLAGGAISTGPASDVTVTECHFESNSSMIGGAVYASGGVLVVEHNIFVANNANATGGAIVANSLGGGSVVGNTFYGNSSGAVAGASIASSPIEVFNNIIAESTGSGLSCTGTPAPDNSYNLLWANSGGDYQGTLAGTGAVALDPLFADAAGGDFHLSLNSPAIDTGRPDPAYNDPDGSRGDMGYYGSHAFAMDQPSYPKNLNAAINGGDVILSWDANPEGDIASYAIYCDTISAFVPGPDNFVGLVAGTETETNLGASPDSSFYRISAVDTDGYAGGYSNEATAATATAVGDAAMPPAYHLGQNVPNPFNPVTTIDYELADRSIVTLEVFDVDGRRVRTLVRESKAAGPHRIVWDATNDRGQPVASGLYFYRLRAGNFTKTKKMVLLR